MFRKSGMCSVLSVSDSTLRCSFFQWAEFDDDGNPPWADKVIAKATDTASVAAIETAIETASTSTPTLAKQEDESPLG
jgi:hypothetical protein